MKSDAIEVSQPRLTDFVHRGGIGAQVVEAVDGRPYERDLSHSRSEDGRAHSVPEAGVVSVPEPFENSFRVARTLAARGTEPAWPNPGGILESEGGALCQRRFGVRGELVPDLVCPTVHPQLVSAAHDLRHRLRMVLAVPSFDEESSADAVAFEQRVESRITDSERNVRVIRQCSGHRAGSDVSRFAHVVEGEARNWGGHVLLPIRCSAIAASWSRWGFEVAPKGTSSAERKT